MSTLDARLDLEATFLALAGGAEPMIAERARRDVSLVLLLLAERPEAWLTGEPLPSGATRTQAEAVVHTLTMDTLHRYGDVISDTPDHRVAVRGWIAFGDEAYGQWRRGRTTRAQTQQLVEHALLHLIESLRTIPG